MAKSAVCLPHLLRLMRSSAVVGCVPDSSVHLEKVECVLKNVRVVEVYERKCQERWREVTEDIFAFPVVSKSVIAIYSCFETLS